MKSAGAAIGWNENLHTLGPPWHAIGHTRCTATAKAEIAVTFLTTFSSTAVCESADNSPIQKRSSRSRETPWALFGPERTV